MNDITILGIFVADLSFSGDKIPVSGETILGDNYNIGPGGKGCNQAIAISRLGGKVNFITKIGKDQNAKMALELYEEAGINTGSIIQDPNQSTGVAGIMINEKTGDNAINIVPGAAGSISNKDIDNNIDFIKKSEIFLTQLETPNDVTSYALNRAKETGSVTIFNPAPASDIKESDFKFIDYFTPNETEASFYLGKKVDSKTEIEEAAKTFLAKGVKNIIITLGPKGLYYANSNESFFIDVYSLKDEVIDTTGAGDAFNGAFAYALSNNLKIKDALEFSNKVAAISTTKAGAANAMPNLDEVELY